MEDGARTRPIILRAERYADQNRRFCVSTVGERDPCTGKQSSNDPCIVHTHAVFETMIGGDVYIKVITRLLDSLKESCTSCGTDGRASPPVHEPLTERRGRTGDETPEQACLSLV